MGTPSWSELPFAATPPDRTTAIAVVEVKEYDAGTAEELGKEEVQEQQDEIQKSDNAEGSKQARKSVATESLPSIVHAPPTKVPDPHEDDRQSAAAEVEPRAEQQTQALLVDRPVSSLLATTRPPDLPPSSSSVTDVTHTLSVPINEPATTSRATSVYSSDDQAQLQDNIYAMLRPPTLPSKKATLPTYTNIPTAPATLSHMPSRGLSVFSTSQESVATKAFAHRPHAKDQEHHAKMEHLRNGPLSIQHLWMPLIVRQYIQGGKLYKEVGQRRVSKFELFGDLSLAGIAHVLAEGPAEDPDPAGLAKFLICFFPVWSVWRDMRDFGSVSGTDDIKMRLYILINMLLLYGYTANAAVIEVEKNALTGKYTITETSYAAIRAASLFFLVAKGIRILIYLCYAFVLRKFSKSFLLSAAAMFCNTGLYIAIPMINNQTLLLILPCLAIAGDLYARYLLVIIGKIHNIKILIGGGDEMCIPAINLDHALERTVQFMIIIFGEVVLNCMYIAKETEIGVRAEFGRSALGIIIAFDLIWLYFDADSTRTFIHAMRRNWFTGILYTVIQFPLAASTILLSASLTAAIKNDEFNDGMKLFFAGGTCVSLLLIAVTGTLHKGLDLPNSGILARSLRLGLRYLVSVVILCLPMYGPDNTTWSLGIVALILSVLVAIETLAKIGSVRMDVEYDIGLDPNSRTHRHWHRHKNDLTEVEKGQEDVGTAEGELGQFEVRDMHLTQRLAYAA